MTQFCNSTVDVCLYDGFLAISDKVTPHYVLSHINDLELFFVGSGGVAIWFEESCSRFITSTLP